MVWNSKDQKYVRGREDHFQRDLKPLEYPGRKGSLKDATRTLKDEKGKDKLGLFSGHDFLWAGVVSATPQEAKDNNVWIDDRAVLKDNDGRFPVIQKDGSTKGYYVSQSGTAAISADQKKNTPGWKFLQSSYGAPPQFHIVFFHLRWATASARAISDW